MTKRGRLELHFLYFAISLIKCAHFCDLCGFLEGGGAAGKRAETGQIAATKMLVQGTIRG
jgi:hypothetical protein